MRLIVSGILIFALLVLAYVFVVTTVRYESKKRTYFLPLVVCAWIDILGYLFEINSVGVEASLLAHTILWIGGVFIAPLLLLFATDFANLKVHRLLVALLLSISIIHLAVIVTNQYHSLYWLDFWVNDTTQLYRFAFEHGILYRPFSIFNFACAISAILILLYNAKRSHSFVRRQSLLFAILAVVPFIGNLLFSLQVYIFHRLNLTVISLSIMVLLCYVVAVKYKLFHLVPIASKRAIQSMKDLFIVLDYNKYVLEANPAAIELFPELNDNTGSLNINSVSGLADALLPVLDDSLVQPFTIELPMGEKNNRHFMASITPIFDKTKVLGWLILFHDVTDTVNMMIKLEQMATTDSLTGIHNRSFFVEQAKMKLLECKRGRKSVAILLFDFDKFKSINDTYGHSGGDAVLCSATKVISDLLRPYDLFARYGGEEFILFLAETDANATQEVAERMRKAIEKHTTAFESNNIGCTISIGIAVSGDSSAELQDIVDAADRVLYLAKENGRNRVEMTLLK